MSNTSNTRAAIASANLRVLICGVLHRLRRHMLYRMLALGVLGLSSLPTSAAAVPNPVVNGPIPASAAPGDPSHDYIFFASPIDLAARGYVEEEYFISGTANRYFIRGTSTGNVLDTNHPYKTRIVVRRPMSADRFNGVVVVECVDTTDGFDSEHTWFELDEHLLRSGYAWVGVSAQRWGVNHLRTWNSSRYGTLDVSQRNSLGGETFTNDDLLYDVLSQAAQALRFPVGIDPLGGLHAQVIIATGHSYSAQVLTRYVNAVQPLTHAFDAFAVHGSLGEAIRVDLEVPVWKILSEFDVTSLEAAARRPDEGLFRTWEVAGTSHFDYKMMGSQMTLQLRDTGKPVDVDPPRLPWNPGNTVEQVLSCGVRPPGSTVPFHHVMAAGLEQLVRWVKDGTPMRSAPALVLQRIAESFIPVRDAFGNAKGGIRLPQTEVPIAVHDGTNWGAKRCPGWGYSQFFDEARLCALYPDHDLYVSRVADGAAKAVLEGFIQPADAEETIDGAMRSVICGACPGGGSDTDGDRLCDDEDPDDDNDGLRDEADNCPQRPNLDQLDSDGEGQGNVCQVCTAGMLDTDRDGVCDVADRDDDDDGVLDAIDNCPLKATPDLFQGPRTDWRFYWYFVPDQSDRDADGFGDACDNCPAYVNPDQTDTDNDGRGNVCDCTDQNPDQSDSDVDGIRDACDSCPYHPSADQTDTDRDGRGNVCECGDQNGDGRNTVSDLVAINRAIFNPAVVSPLCDANNDLICGVDDMMSANVEIFSPGNTSTCQRQPVPGP